jgi:hypothetical protein
VRSSSDRLTVARNSSVVISDRRHYQKSGPSDSSYVQRQERAVHDEIGSARREINTLGRDLPDAARHGSRREVQDLLEHGRRIRKKLDKLHVYDENTSQLSGLSPIDLLTCRLDDLLEKYRAFSR